MTLDYFHAAVTRWFRQNFTAPTEVQRQAWPAIKDHQPTLIAAPTGSGKTLAGFMAAIDDLVREGLTHGLRNETQVLYISPLKALSNDIQKNLQQPLNGIRDALLEEGLPDVDIRAWVRTGDTPQGERQKARKQPPHIMVTTPESLYILLSSASGRDMLHTVRTVIVDEIHALAGSKRGSHLLLSLERLDALCRKTRQRAPVRIGISATQKPIERMAEYLMGTHAPRCKIIDTGHVRQRDLAIEVTGSPLEAVMANETWGEIYQRLEELINSHRTTLIFVNTRRLAERAAHNLAERIGEEYVTAHHGSLAREHRLNAEQRLKAGKLKALVATASLELGIDIGDIDLVCQLGSPRSIAAFLQRVGRSGHAVHALPKGRLFPLSRDDLLECTALLDAIQRQELDQIVTPNQPLDVLAQHIVAEVSSGEWQEEELYKTVVQAWPYRNLTRENFSAVVDMLASGYSTKRGRRGAYIHRDVINGKVRARRGANLVALTNGGAIPDQFDYDVILQPEGISVGTLNEDFAFESLPGDIFQLGNTSYRMLKIENGRVFVEDAHGQPPNIPFWFGEAPGRSDELSSAVSRLLINADEVVAEAGIEGLIAWLQEQHRLPPEIAVQLGEYLATAKAVLGTLPSHQTIVFERFFDDVGDMHFVIHAPFGSRINRAWGLALRKRFCRRFNFELQAAANDNNIVLSLGPTHSFPLAEVADYLKSQTVREILIQALLAAPMFDTRWRWNANISLAVPRNRNGKKVPAQFQRSNAQDLVAVVFPDQLACFENLQGDREVPDHPLVEQTVNDCLHETMDIAGLETLLQRLENRHIQLVTCDLPAPSPLSEEIINAKPYAFLDDAPAEERRTLAISQHALDPQSAADMVRLDAVAIQTVRQEAWPDARTPDELHDGLMMVGFMTETEVERGPLHETQAAMDFGWQHLIDALRQERRITLLTTPDGKNLWLATERLSQFLALFPQADYRPIVPLLSQQSSDPQEALVEITRSRLEGLGPVTALQLSAPLGIPVNSMNIALLALEQEGFAIQGRFTHTSPDSEWCERGLLARIHRYTVKSLRREIEAVSPMDYTRFLFHWHGLGEKADGKEALAGVLEQLEGCALPAYSWERDILPARMDLYIPDWLDSLCTSGRFTWLRPPAREAAAKVEAKSESNQAPNENITRKRKPAPVKNTPVSLFMRQHAGYWCNAETLLNQTKNLNANALKVYEALKTHGASFFFDLVTHTQLLRTQVEDALGELVSYGLVTADNFTGLRALITPANKKHGFRSRRNYRSSNNNIDDAGRWTLIQKSLPPSSGSNPDDHPLAAFNIEKADHIARTLLKRYGVVFRKVLEKETGLPPWRDLLYVYRRMEARGEIRGGRFVSGFAGEQFALPDAVNALRNLRKKDKTGDLITLSAVDPLNLTGIITPGQRVPANINNRILYKDGKPIAVSIAGEIKFLEKTDNQTEWEIRNRLIRKHNPTQYVTTSVPQ
jgi:ATP-dependent Lhr-like helicase